MTRTLKISATLVLLACATHAAPLYGDASLDTYGGVGCTGGACEQAVNSGTVQVGSSTNVFPETNVIPITRVQPIVQGFAPIVNSECDYPLAGYDGLGGIGYGGYGSYGGLGGNSFLRDAALGSFGGLGGYSSLGFNDMRGLGSLFKRQIDPSLLQQQAIADCVPSETVSCDMALPQSNVQMGSQVGIVPATQVTPQTFVQGTVQSLAANIDAAAAQASALPQQTVSLGSNVNIQPSTAVMPQTFYQPALSSLATQIDAAPAQDYALPQSSVSLGSTVGIAPVTTVTPLTFFQPQIISRPFLISAETNCEQGFPGSADAVPLGAAMDMAASSDAAFGSPVGSPLAANIMRFGTTGMSGINTLSGTSFASRARMGAAPFA